MMAYNLWKSIADAKAVNGTIAVYTENYSEDEELSVTRTFINAPVVFTTLGLLAAFIWLFTTGWLNVLGLFATIFSVLLAIGHFKSRGTDWGEWYD